MDIAIATVADLLISDLEKRIAATLLRIAPETDHDPIAPLVICRITQAQLEEMANAAMES